MQYRQVLAIYFASLLLFLHTHKDTIIIRTTRNDLYIGSPVIKTELQLFGFQLSLIRLGCLGELSPSVLGRSHYDPRSRS